MLTYSGLDPDANFEAMRTAIRSGLHVEACFRALEALQAPNQRVKLPLLKHLYMAAVRDVGRANPSLILWIDGLLNIENKLLDPYNQLIIVRVVELLVKSPKSDLFDVIRLNWVPNEEYHYNNPVDNMRFFLFQLDTLLEERNFRESCETLGRCFTLCRRYPNHNLDQPGWKKIKMALDGPKIFTFGARMIDLIWLPILHNAIDKNESQNLCNLICYLYHFACKRNDHFMSCTSEEIVSFALHAIWSLCNSDEVNETWYADNKCKLESSLEEEIDRIERIVEHSKHGCRLRT
jgi:hypothetical protein